MNKLWAIWLMLFPVLLNAQADFEPLPIDKESYRAYIGFSAGPSNPFGGFSNDDLNFYDGGYAERGISFNLDFGYRFYENLIIAGNYSRINNPYNEDALKGKVEFQCASCTTSTIYNDVQASDYELNVFLVGIGFVKDMDDLSFQMQFMGGYGNMYTPQIDLSNRRLTTLTLKSNSEGNLAYGFGTGMRIHLTDQLDLGLNGTFILYQANFDQEIVFGSESESISSSLRYQVFNLNFGLAYRFVKKTDESEYKLKY